MDKVLFSFKKENITLPNTTLPNKSELFDKIRENGMHPIVGLMAESAFDETGVQGHELVDGERTRSIGHTAIQEVGVVVNRLDRSFRQDDMPARWREVSPPTLNENAMRSLVFRKARVQEEVFTPLGLGMPTQLVENAVDVVQFVINNPSTEYVVKPNSGTNSEDVHYVDGDQAIKMFSGNLPDKSMIIQPRYDFSHSLDPKIQPFDALSNEAFNGWGKSDSVKELRMYGFYSPLGVDLFPVARAMKGSTDHWFFIDPESVPTKLFTDTRDVITRSAKITGSRAIYGALDFGYGAARPDEQPDYHIIELNARMPYLVGYDKHPHVADILRTKMADQIKDTTEFIKNER